MNHYQRLKIAQDAPPEVIRAAYRALATKLHPDRQGPDTGPADALHSEMAALNAAYETLIDPKLRADYDATLSSAPRVDSAWLAHPGAADAPDAAAGAASPGGAAAVDVDWLRPHAVKPGGASSLPVRREVLIGGGAVVAAVLGLLGYMVWQVTTQRQTEEALSRDFKDRPEQVATASPPAPMRPAVSNDPLADRKPSVDELARMSDEELMKALPLLDGQERPTGTSAAVGSAGSAQRAHHPLDGTPLRLRTDLQLIDPLAPEPLPKR